MRYQILKSKSNIINFLNSLENLPIGFDEMRSSKLRLILEELLTNSLNYANDSQEILEIDINNDPLKTHVTYSDFSKMFNIVEYYEKYKEIIQEKVACLEEGGLGLMLVFQFADDLKYYYDENHNKNVIQFQL